MLPKSLADAKLLVFEIVLHNQFTNEADRDQLNTYNDHRNTKESERTITEGCSAKRPFNDEIEIGYETNHCKQRSNSTKEVKRTLDVARRKHHGEKIEISLQETAHSELRHTVLTCSMLHRDFCYSEALPMSKRRDITVHFTIHLNILDDLSAISLESAIEVVKSNTAHARSHSIKQL